MNSLKAAREAYAKQQKENNNASKADRMNELIAKLNSWQSSEELSKISNEMKKLSLGLMREAYSGSSAAADALSKYESASVRLPYLQTDYGSASSKEEYEIQQKNKQNKSFDPTRNGVGSNTAMGARVPEIRPPAINPNLGRNFAYQPKYTAEEQDARGKNATGFLGGLGYLGASALAGIGSAAEGISDVLIALGADISGNHKYAENTFKDNMVGDWYSSVTEEFNPGSVMEFVGNVGHGLGQSSYFLLDSVVPGLGTGAFFAGVSAQGVSNAAAITGDVGAREVAYGVIGGAVEAALEKASGGMSKLAKNIGSATMKNVSRAAVRQGLVRQVLSDAAGEFGEEFASEYIDTFLQRNMGIDPDKEYSFKDALYAGAVGFVSGSVSAGVGDVARAGHNQRVGAKVIKDGNSQTLVNTATSVADKLAAQGTNWKRAPEWVKALRGQVDAYNKLSPEAKSGLRGQTILGEMQSSLYFAETQAIFDARQEQIQKASEQDRATWAEYINLNYDKSRRNNKDYTAADIANNTDNVAWQLAVFSYVPTMFNLDAAVVDYDAAQESGIANVIAKNQGTESGGTVGTNEPVIGTNESVIGTNESVIGTNESVIETEQYDLAKNAEAEERRSRAAEKFGYTSRFETAGYILPDGRMLDLGEGSSVKTQDHRAIAEVFDGEDGSRAMNRFISEGNVRIIDAAPGIEISASSAPTVSQYNTISRFIERSRPKGHFDVDFTDAQGNVIGSLSYDSGVDTAEVIYDIRDYFKSGAVRDTTRFDLDTAQDASKANGEEIRNESASENAANLRSEAVEVEGEQTGAETVQDETAGASPRPTGEFDGQGEVIDGATSSSTVSDGPPSPLEKADLERAKRDAERMIAWEKKNAPSAKELDTVRGYVKNFDSLPADRQLFIVRMMRSSEGVNADTVRGVANLMAITNRKGEVLAPDLEFRFAEFGKDSTRRGIKTEVGGKTVIVLNSNSTYKDTIRGSIAHEVVHYLENRKGYKALAEFAMKHAKADKKAEVEKTYTDYYRKEYTRQERAKDKSASDNEIAARVEERLASDKFKALLDSEVTAKVVGEMLNSEKFLKRYAQMGEEQGSMLKRIAKFVRGIANALKEKDKKAGEVAREMMTLVDKALGSEVAREKSGEKYSVIQKDGVYYTPTDEEIIKNHPTINGVIINDAEYAEGHTLPDDEYKAYRKSQAEKAKKVVGTYTNKDTTYSDEYGLITAEFKTPAIRKGKSYGGIALYDILPYVPQIFENAVVINTKPDSESNTNIKGIVNLVGCAILNNKYVAVVKLNVKEYANDEAKIYDNRVIEIEELTVVDRVGHQEVKTPSGSTSSAVSSEYIIAKFREFVNTSDKKSSDKEQYDLDPETVEREVERLTPKTDVKGQEVSDEYFEAAVARAREEANLSAEERRQIAQQRSEAAIESRKTKFEKLLGKAYSIQRKIEKLEKTAGQDVDAAELKKLKRQYRDVLGEMAGLQIDLRQMGYDLNAEQRLIERQQKQIENQSREIGDLRAYKRNNERLERETAIIKDMESREEARQARLYAKQKAEIGKVYSESEIKREIKDMVESGLASRFFGGQYTPKLSMEKINAISRYIALQLNMAKSEEQAEAQGLIRVAALDILRSMKFTDADGNKTTLNELVDSDTAKQFADMLTTDLVDIIRNAGEINPYAEIVRKYRSLEAEFNKKTTEGEAWGKQFPKTVAQARKMKTLATQKKGIGSDSVQEITKVLGGLADESGRLRTSKIDEAMKKASTFFEAEAMKMQSQENTKEMNGENGDNANEKLFDFNPRLLFDVERFIQMRQGREGTLLSAEELKLLADLLEGMRTTLERYNREQVNGRWVDANKVAAEELQDLTRQTEAKTAVSKFLNTKLGKFLNDVYFYEILSPETVIESLEDFKTAGLLKTMYHDIRTAKQKAKTKAARMKEPFRDFIDDKKNEWTDEKGHKHSFRKKLDDKVIKIYGKEINLGEAIYLYMLTKREHSHLGLKENGYITYDDTGNEKTRVRIEDIDLARNELLSQFDEADKEFVEMAEKFFNETASKAKYEADMKIFGYSNNGEGYYVPIIRDRYSRMNGVTDMRQSVSSIVTVYNMSFTQNITRNALPLEGKNIMRIINDHADGLADYAELYLPLKAFDRIYNRAVQTTQGVTSIREILNKHVWNDTENYLKDLFADIQGQSTSKMGKIGKAVARLRSGWVNSVLGANIKVVFTQTTSLGAATQVIDAKYVARASYIITPGVGYAEGVKAIADRADKYSDIIFARSFDMGALMAQGNIDKVTDLGKKTGTLIEWMDRKVCIAVFHAAELQVEAQTGYKVGTEENATRAAKLADETIYTTQAMDSQAEKSALQREKSEIAKLFSMFTSDTVKNLSHLWGNVMKWNAHRNRVKNGETAYEAELKKDGRAALRSLRTMGITGVMIGLITQGFKYLYNKEEEEPEDKIRDFAVDITSSTLNVFPIFSEFIDKIFLDYDLSINVLDIVNDTLDAVGGGFDIMGSVFAGEYVSDQKIAKTSANMLKSGAALFGIPVSPIERTVTGLLRRFFPSAIYGYDAMMSNPSYSADLQAAVKSGDERLAEHILSTLYKNEATGVYSTPELEEIVRLYSVKSTDGKSINVLPQKIGAEINGVKLDRKQRAQFEKIYGEASAKVNELIRSAYYEDLTDEQKAKAIKNVYSLYYNKAAAEVVNAEWSNGQAYSRLTNNVPALYAAQAYKSGLAVKKNARGEEISVKDQFAAYAKNLGLSDNDLLVVLYANGYRDAKTKAELLKYINSLSMSADDKSKIAETLGFEIKNGRMVEKE
jgi:hypothetical protein